ncbi:MAG: alpha/beta fold hydrolase [Dehalococcoidia bacterium]
MISSDFIAFDFRGTGLSGKLACTEYDSVLADALKEKLTEQQTDMRYDAAMDLCLERYAADGVDLSTYDSATIVEDMVELMTALGYDEWNLIGGSYGTRLALTAVRDAPEHIRSAVLDARRAGDRCRRRAHSVVRVQAE